MSNADSEKDGKPEAIDSAVSPVWFSSAACARIVTSVTGLADGYDIGAISGALVMLKGELSLTSSQVGAITGIAYFGMAAGAPLGGGLADMLGRKKALGFTYALLVAGSLGSSCATSFEHLVATRLLLGLGVGGGFSVVSTYMTEVSPRSHRGRLVGLEDLFLVVGILCGYSMNFVLAGVPNDWRWMLGLGAVCPLLAFLLLLFPQLPESPRWDMLRGNSERAMTALRTLVGEEEAAKLMEEWDEVEEPCSWLELLAPTSAWRRHAVVASVGMNIISLASGLPVVTLYLGSIFAMDAPARLAFQLSMTLAVCRIIGIIICIFYMLDSIGRRPLGLLSTGGLAISSAAMAAAYGLEGQLLPWKFGAITLFWVSHAIGLSALPFVYSTEVLPTDMRSKGTSLGIFSARLAAAATLYIFPLASDAIGIHGVFVIMAIVNTISLVFVWFCVPETIGSSLEEISHILREKTGEAYSPDQKVRRSPLGTSPAAAAV